MPVVPSKVVQAIPPSVPFVAPEALERRLGVQFRLRMGANESPFGPAPEAIEAMQEAAARGSFYGDPQSIALREAISDRHGVDTDRIRVASGIDDLLILLCRAYLSPGDRVATTQGSYPTFEFAARAAGAEIVAVPYKADRPDLEALANVAGAKIVYLANPDNPSGTYYASEEVHSLRRRMAEGSLLLLDEAYADFVPENPQLPTDTVRLRTFSKAHGLAGLRIGYAIADPTVGEVLDRIRPHFGVNSVAQAGALASLGAHDHIATVVRKTEAGRSQLKSIVRRLGYGFRDTATNFVLIDAGDRPSAEALLDRLLRAGVFVRKPAGSPLERYIRVTVGTETMTEEFGKILAQVT